MKILRLIVCSQCTPLHSTPSAHKENHMFALQVEEPQNFFLERSFIPSIRVLKTFWRNKMNGRCCFMKWPKAAALTDRFFQEVIVYFRHFFIFLTLCKRKIPLRNNKKRLFPEEVVRSWKNVDCVSFLQKLSVSSESHVAALPVQWDKGSKK